MKLYNPCVGVEIEVCNPDISRGVLLDIEATYTCEVCGESHTVTVEDPSESTNTAGA